jgi:hypothetical protein
MAAKKKTDRRSRFGRFKERVSEASGTTTLSYTRGQRTFRPFVRVTRPANDNRLPVALLLLRTLMVIVLLGLLGFLIV